MLIQQLGWEGSKAVLDEIARTIFMRGGIDCEVLRPKFPEFGGYYNPEEFGKD